MAMDKIVDNLNAMRLLVPAITIPAVTIAAATSSAATSPTANAPAATSPRRGRCESIHCLPRHYHIYSSVM